MSMSTPLLESRSCCARVEGREGEGACHTIDAYLEIGRYGRHGRWPLLTAHRPLPAARCPLRTASCSLPTA